MVRTSRDIQAQILKLEKQKQQLIVQRKEEIGRIFEQIGGLTLDNRLLKGLVLYAQDPKHKESDVLKTLIEFGSKKRPSRSSSAKAFQKTTG